MIREATEKDLSALVDLGEKFFNSTILSDLSNYDHESVGMMLLSLIENETGLVLVYEVKGVVSGGFAGILVPAYWNLNILAAQQIAWFVDPASRSIKTLALLDKWEQWADAKGAKVIFSGAKKDSRFKGMDAMLQRRKYIDLESMHVKGVV